ncbi:MAG: hypothetical protein ACTSV2_11420, partial [Candidatus Thorarchaeota archaeon]
MGVVMMVSGQEWDISQIVNGASTPEVKVMLDTILDKFEKLTSEYTENLSSMGLLEIADMLRTIENVLIEADDIFTYCWLHNAANSLLPKSKQLYSWYQTANSQIQVLQTVLEKKLTNILLQKPELLAASELEDFTHYLEGLKKGGPYRLSNAEEKLIATKDVNGVLTLSQLRTSWISQKSFEIELEGEMKTVSLPTLDSLRMSPNRSVREMASR